ncbi:MAG: 6-bladed beta-propeller [Longimicrobiales bacterium]
MSVAPARTDSAGVALVVNAPTDRALDWTFEPVLILGGVDDGPAAFFRVFPTSIGVDSTGHLYVLDAGNFTVSVFDRSGEHLRSFGRQGQGPGELGFPSDMAVTPSGEAAVYDFARRALVFIDADGSFTGTFALPGPLQRQVALLDDGTVVAEVTQATVTADSTDYRLLALGGDTVNVAWVRQFSQPEPRQTTCGSVAMPPYFGPRLVWAAAGNRIAVSDDATCAIRIVDGNRLVGIWRRDLPPIRSSPQLAAWEAARGDSLRFPGGCALSAEEAATQFGYHETAPLIQGLAVSPDGAIWLRRRTDVPGESQIDVMDATGAYVGTLSAESPFPALFRGTDEIVAVETDEFSRPLVVVYRIRRGS